MDISYFQQNSTHVFGQGFPATPKSHVFPLSKRPFQGKLVQAPRDPRRVLSSILEGSSTGDFQAERVCRGAKVNQEKVASVPSVPCSGLIHKFPFVRHMRSGGGSYCKEELVYRGKVLSVFYRCSMNIPVCWGGGSLELCLICESCMQKTFIIDCIYLYIFIYKNNNISWLNIHIFGLILDRLLSFKDFHTLPLHIDLPLCIHRWYNTG